MAALLVVLALAAVHCCALLASATTWTVGDSQGWTIGPDYSAWAAGKNFSVGDVLFFPYAAGQHDVVEVAKSGYDACSSANAIATHSDANTNITLNSTGTFYYLCSFTGHCTAGMKLAVTVQGSVNATTPTPAPASAPAPATRTPAPASAPAPTRTNSSTVPVPAPTPSGTARTPISSPGSSAAPAPLILPNSPPPPSSTPGTSAPGSPPSDSPRLRPAAVPLATFFFFLSAALLAI